MTSPALRDGFEVAVDPVGLVGVDGGDGVGGGDGRLDVFKFADNEVV